MSYRPQCVFVAIKNHVIDDTEILISNVSLLIKSLI
jgi:hypothetical protein